VSSVGQLINWSVGQLFDKENIFASLIIIIKARRSLDHSNSNSNSNSMPIEDIAERIDQSIGFAFELRRLKRLRRLKSNNIGISSFEHCNVLS
jgi:hypothetical protein